MYIQTWLHFFDVKGLSNSSFHSVVVVFGKDGEVFRVRWIDVLVRVVLVDGRFFVTSLMLLNSCS